MLLFQFENIACIIVLKRATIKDYQKIINEKKYRDH